jgi:hypothetical protein
LDRSSGRVGSGGSCRQAERVPDPPHRLDVTVDDLPVGPPAHDQRTVVPGSTRLSSGLSTHPCPYTRSTGSYANRPTDDVLHGELSERTLQVANVIQVSLAHD